MYACKIKGVGGGDIPLYLSRIILTKLFCYCQFSLPELFYETDGNENQPASTENEILCLEINHIMVCKIRS